MCVCARVCVCVCVCVCSVHMCVCVCSVHMCVCECAYMHGDNFYECVHASIRVTSRIDWSVKLIVTVCQRTFRWECHMARQKCIPERHLLIYQYKNKLEQCSVLRVRDVEGHWLFTSVLMAIMPIPRKVSQWPHKQC